LRTLGWLAVAFLVFQAVACLTSGTTDARIVGGVAGVTALLFTGALLMTRPEKRERATVSACDGRRP
jgi:hypothetical protein